MGGLLFPFSHLEVQVLYQSGVFCISKGYQVHLQVYV